MGMKYGQGKYYGTRGSIVQTYYGVPTKSAAKSMIPLLPDAVRKTARSFIDKGSNLYDRFSAHEDTSGNIVLTKEKPGNVQGSRAIYFLIVDSNGNKVDSYKETYDPQGNLVHSKEK